MFSSNDKPHSRRLKIVRINRGLLADLLRLDGSRRLRITGLPDDVKIVAVSELIYFDSDDIAIKVESATFDEIGADGAIPQIVLECEEFCVSYINPK